MAFYDNGKMKAVTFSYDDGITQDVRMINLMNKYNLKSTFNINSGLLARKGLITWDGVRVSHYKVHPEDVKSIYQGHEVAVHTVGHRLLPQCTDEEVIYQVETDRLTLSNLVGYEVVGMAYPGGPVNNDDRVAEVIKNHTGVKYARTIKSTGSFDLQDNLFRFDPTGFHTCFDALMKLGREFVEMQPEEPKIFYIWGHSYEMDYGDDYWLRLEEFFKLISGHDDIFYGTNKEVLL